MQNLPDNKIDPSAIHYWRWSGLLNTIFLCIIPGAYYGATRIWHWPLWILYPLSAILLLYAIYSIAIIPQIMWNTWRYDVSEQQIDLLFGVIIKHRTLIPMVRVQHVDTEQGPLLRRFGLSTVTISTAAGNHEIPALSDEIAAELRDRISELARVVEEDV